jgi:hypothetical protein
VYLNNIKVVFLNASFNDNLFTYLLETYPNQQGNITIPKYTSHIENKDSIIIRMYPDNKYWKGAFKYRSKKRTFKQIFEVLKILERHIPKEKIGVITYQKSSKNEKYPTEVEKEFQTKNYHTIHFWDEAGLNILEDKYALIVVGTPFIPTEEVIDIWEKIFDEKPDFSKEHIGMKDEGGYYITDGFEKLEYWDWEVGVFLKSLESIDEILDRWGYLKPGWQWHHDVLLKRFNDLRTKKYDFTSVKHQYLCQLIDSIHRNRPLTHNRVVIVFGDIIAKFPWDAWKQGTSQYSTVNSMNQLLGLKQIETDDLTIFENTIKTHKITIENKIRVFFDFILDNQDYISNSSIAKVLNVWDNNKNPDVTFIQDVQKIIKDIKKKI